MQRRWRRACQRPRGQRRNHRTGDEHDARGSNGWIIPATYSGMYHVNADCTGFKSATLSIGGAVGPTINFDFVIDDDLREIRMIVADSGFAVSGSARKLFKDAKNKQ